MTPFPQAQHIGVVVPTRHSGQIFVEAKRGPDARHSVGGYGHAESCAADENAYRALFVDHVVATLAGREPDNRNCPESASPHHALDGLDQPDRFSTTP